jgi:hypothetical protein
MITYLIKGADKTTGKDIERKIVSTARHTAETFAQTHHNMVVASVEELPDTVEVITLKRIEALAARTDASVTTIRKWVTFIGWVILIPILLSALYMIVGLAAALSPH